MAFEIPKSAIRLDAYEDCPHCGRPLLSLASDRCAFCGKSMEAIFETLPSVVSGLEALAPGWTPERLRAWALPLPSLLARCLSEGFWRNLGHVAAEPLWLGWANRHASLKGRNRALQVEDVQVQDLRLCGLSEAPAWVELRLRGQRAHFTWDPTLGLATEGGLLPESFTEVWRAVPTGRPEDSKGPVCTGCGAPMALQARSCSRCGSPAAFQPGPWLLVAVHGETAQGESRCPSPFEGVAGFLPEAAGADAHPPGGDS